MGSNSFRVEGLARGVPVSKLFEFYTDYSPEDVEIMRRHGMYMALERVAHREGNHVIVDTTAKMMGMTRNMRYDILLHPEEKWYEMVIEIQGFVKSRRSYKFESVPEGTRITIEDQFQPTSILASMMNGFGMLRKRLVSDTTRTMYAFTAEAEERFGGVQRVQGA